MLLLLAAATSLSAVGRQICLRRCFCIGLLCGLALLFTQKSLIPIAGIGFAACGVPLLDPPRARAAGIRSAIQAGFVMVAGIVSVWGLATLLFARAGGATNFWYSTWYQLWIWPVRSSRWEYLRSTLIGDLTVWLFAAIETLGVAASWWRRRELNQRTEARPPDSVDSTENVRFQIAILAGFCVASLPFVKATYPQFYLLWMPYLAVLAASRLAIVAAEIPRSNRSGLIAFVSVLLAVVQSALWWRAFDLGPDGALPRVTALPSANFAILPGLGMLTGAAAVLAIKRRWGCAGMIICLLGMNYGLLRNLDYALWSNRGQVAAIEAVQQQIGPDEKVLDGFTGLAALRPHAWYYWWINPYSLALVSQHERETALREHLEVNPPAAVLFDQNVELLPQSVVAWIRENYEPAQPPRLWKPKAKSKL
jgi:hypothetical protein